VRVHLFDSHDPATPDAVFPNNWFSTHAGGHVALYPMYAANRRRERRGDIIEMLKAQYRVQDVIDYSGLEHDSMALEGTGAMVPTTSAVSPTPRNRTAPTRWRWSASARISTSSPWPSPPPTRRATLLPHQRDALRGHRLRARGL
jgi:hypothetical protein